MTWHGSVELTTRIGRPQDKNTQTRRTRAADMWMLSWREVCPLMMMVRFCTASVATSTTSNPLQFSREELQYFASLQLCDQFHGKCDPACPFKVITHRLGIPLCPVDGKIPSECCLGGDLVPSDARTQHLLASLTQSPPYRQKPDDSDTCGKIAHFRRKRVVGGLESTVEVWPWLVHLMSELGGVHCSGTVIARRWVITAAHCFSRVPGPDLWKVRVGVHNILLVENPGSRDLSVQEIYLHPDFRVDRNLKPVSNNSATLHITRRFLHDLALVKLTEEVIFSPLCLPSFDRDAFGDDGLNSDWRRKQETEEIHKYRLSFDLDLQDSARLPEYPENGEYLGWSLTKSCWVAGWGKTTDKTVKRQVLHEVSGEIMGNSKCSHQWGRKIGKNMLCFGDGTYGPCTGDSGSPVACEENGHFKLLGVVSWGSRECNVKGYPSVFTCIKPYLPWVLAHIHS